MQHSPRDQKMKKVKSKNKIVSPRSLMKGFVINAIDRYNTNQSKENRPSIKPSGKIFSCNDKSKLSLKPRAKKIDFDKQSQEEFQRMLGNKSVSKCIPK